MNRVCGEKDTDLLVTAEARDERQRRLRDEVESIYDELTGGLHSPLRVSELVRAAGERYPNLVPTRAAIEAERERPLKDRLGLEIDQGVFVAHVLAHPKTGLHLMHAMTQPRPEAVARLKEFRRVGTVDLGPMRVDRAGAIGHVTIQNHAFLNSEDDVSTSALEIAIDLVLLDDAIEVGVLRGGLASHPKYAGRRIFGSGINLTHLYQGKISLVEFMIERELGLVSKLYRGHGIGVFDDGELEVRREKPWIAAVEAFAIGGACQLLLVMDWVVAEPARISTCRRGRTASFQAAPICACRALSVNAWPGRPSSLVEGSWPTLMRGDCWRTRSFRAMRSGPRSSARRKS